MKRALFAIVAALLAATPALAQDLPAPPIPEPKPFKLPATESFTLPNGMQVTLIPYGVAPKVVVSLRVLAASTVEGKDTWLSDLTADMMKEGAAGRSSSQIATAAADMGGDLNVGAGVQTTTITMNVLSEHAPAAIALVGDVALRPTLPDSELARIKTNLQRNLAQALAQPGVLADVALARTVYGPDHVYGRALATPEQIAAYTLADVRRFHSTQFGAKRARLYIAGRFDAAAVKAAITRTFAGWAAGPDPVKTPAAHAPGPKVILVDRKGAAQTTIRIAFTAPLAGAKGDIDMRVMDALLSGAFSSRITKNIREDKGYTYSPGSGTAFQPGDALWTFEADVTPAVTGASLTEVFKEIRTLQTTPPGDVEAKGIRTYLAGLFAIANSTSGAVLNTVATRDNLGLPKDWLENYVPSVLAVTPQQISASAAETLPLGKMTMVVVGDLATVEPQLKALPELKDVPFQTVTVP
jgi:zinc protease